MEDKDNSHTAPAQMKAECGLEFSMEYQAWKSFKALCGFHCVPFLFTPCFGIWPQAD